MTKIANNVGKSKQIKKKNKSKKGKVISNTDKIVTQLINNGVEVTVSLKKNKRKKNKGISNSDETVTESINNDKEVEESLKKNKSKKAKGISKLDESETPVASNNEQVKESLKKNKRKKSKAKSGKSKTQVADNKKEVKENMKLNLKDRLSDYKQNIEENLSDNDDIDNAEVKKYVNDFGFKDFAKSKENKDFKEIIKTDTPAVTSDNSKKPLAGREDEMERTLCVDNVKLGTNKKILTQLFKKFGKLDSIRFRNLPLLSDETYKMKQIMGKKFKPNRLSMTAYVKFMKIVDCQAAMELHMTVVNDHHILCRASAGREFGVVKNDLKKGLTVLVGGLDKDGEEERVWKKFSGCGEITDIVIPRKRTNCTGVAFVTFAEAASVPAAIKLDNTLIGSRYVRVSKAVRKVKKQKQKVSGSGKKGFHKKVPLQRKKVTAAIEKNAKKTAEANEKAAAAPTANEKAAPAVPGNDKPAAAAVSTNGKAAPAVLASGKEDGKSLSTKFTGTKHEQKKKTKGRSTKRSREFKAKNKFSKMLTLASNKDK